MSKLQTTQQSASSESRGIGARGLVSWLRSVFDRRDLGLLLAILLVVGGTLLLWWLADEVLEGSTHALDHYLIRVLRNPTDPSDPIGPPGLEEAARDVTGLGGYAVLSALILTVATYLGLSGKFHAGLLLLVETGGGLVVMRLLKILVNRPRPNLVPHLSHVTSPSFPSGHAMLSAVVYLTLGSMLALLVQSRRRKLFFIGVAFLLTFLIGISRVYLGVHYPTDVLAGWTAGLVWAVLCWLLTRFLQNRGAIEPSDPPTG